MRELFKERASRQQKRVFSYFKYIFNDHFVLALMFLLGALAFQYANWLKALTPGAVPGRWVLSWIILVSLLLLVGQLATFVDPADIVFLSPGEKHFKDYMCAVFKYSLWWPSAFLTGILALSWPFLTRVGSFSFLSFIGILIGLFGFKWAMLMGQAKAFEHSGENWHYVKYALMLLNGVALLMAFVYGTWLYPLIAVTIFLITLFFVDRVEEERTWNWERLIDYEARRQQRVDAVLSLFVDVPHRMTTVKRRRWADPLLIKQRVGETPYPFLYTRNFWRQSFWLGLWVRLTFVTGIVTFFLPAHWLSLAVITLLLLMNGMQLLPLMNNYDREPLLRIYPNSVSQKAKDGARWLRLPLDITAMVVIFVAIWHYWTVPSFIFLVILVTIATVIMYLWGYLPFRYRKRKH